MSRSKTRSHSDFPRWNGWREPWKSPCPIFSSGGQRNRQEEMRTDERSVIGILPFVSQMNGSTVERAGPGKRPDHAPTPQRLAEIGGASVPLVQDRTTIA